MLTPQPLVLVGAGGHARACIDVIELQGSYAVLGLVGLATEIGSAVLGYRVLGTDNMLGVLRESSANALVAIGQIETPKLRMDAFERLLNGGFQLPTVVSPNAYVSRHAQIGAGSIIMHGAIVNAGAIIGRNCIINSRALVEHDAVVGDHCHVSTAAVVNGGARVGTGSFLGSHSIVRECVRIGDYCVVGMGQSVRADCPHHERVPAGRKDI